MSYTPKQWRAIAWYSKRDNITPQLSAWPNVSFKDPEGLVRTVHIQSLSDWYDADRKEADREKARIKRLESKADRQRESSRIKHEAKQ